MSCQPQSNQGSGGFAVVWTACDWKEIMIRGVQCGIRADRLLQRRRLSDAHVLLFLESLGAG